MLKNLCFLTRTSLHVIILYNELMAWIKPCTIQIILSSHDILHLRAILGLL